MNNTLDKLSKPLDALIKSSSSNSRGRGGGRGPGRGPTGSRGSRGTMQPAPTQQQCKPQQKQQYIQPKAPPRARAPDRPNQQYQQQQQTQTRQQPSVTAQRPPQPMPKSTQASQGSICVAEKLTLSLDDIAKAGSRKAATGKGEAANKKQQQQAPPERPAPAGRGNRGRGGRVAPGRGGPGRGPYDLAGRGTGGVPAHYTLVKPQVARGRGRRHGPIQGYGLVQARGYVGGAPPRRVGGGPAPIQHSYGMQHEGHYSFHGEQEYDEEVDEYEDENGDQQHDGEYDDQDYDDDYTEEMDGDWVEAEGYNGTAAGRGQTYRQLQQRPTAPQKAPAAQQKAQATTKNFTFQSRLSYLIRKAPRDDAPLPVPPQFLPAGSDGSAAAQGPSAATLKARKHEEAATRAATEAAQRASKAEALLKRLQRMHAELQIIAAGAADQPGVQPLQQAGAPGSAPVLQQYQHHAQQYAVLQVRPQQAEQQVSSSPLREQAPQSPQRGAPASAQAAASVPLYTASAAAAASALHPVQHSCQRELSHSHAQAMAFPYGAQEAGAGYGPDGAGPVSNWDLEQAPAQEAAGWGAQEPQAHGPSRSPFRDERRAERRRGSPERRANRSDRSRERSRERGQGRSGDRERRDHHGRSDSRGTSRRPGSSRRERSRSRDRRDGRDAAGSRRSSRSRSRSKGRQDTRDALRSQRASRSRSRSVEPPEGHMLHREEGYRADERAGNAGGCATDPWRPGEAPHGAVAGAPADALYSLGYPGVYGPGPGWPSPPRQPGAYEGYEQYNQGYGSGYDQGYDPFVAHPPARLGWLPPDLPPPMDWPQQAAAPPFPGERDWQERNYEGRYDVYPGETSRAAQQHLAARNRREPSPAGHGWERECDRLPPAYERERSHDRSHDRSRDRDRRRDREREREPEKGRNRDNEREREPRERDRPQQHEAGRERERQREREQDHARGREREHSSGDAGRDTRMDSARQDRRSDDRRSDDRQGEACRHTSGAAAAPRHERADRPGAQREVTVGCRLRADTEAAHTGEGTAGFAAAAAAAAGTDQHGAGDRRLGSRSPDGAMQPEQRAGSPCGGSAGGEDKTVNGAYISNGSAGAYGQPANSGGEYAAAGDAGGGQDEEGEVQEAQAGGEFYEEMVEYDLPDELDI